MIRIANWLLTRRCNLQCSYCAISKDYKNKPGQYPDLSYYNEHEMSTNTIINYLGRLKKHNPDMFHIIYGGEPMLRTDLPEIIQYCNDENIHYTIITNNSESVQPAIKTLISKVKIIKGITSSIDPIIMVKDTSTYKDIDRLKKSKNGFNRLVNLKKIVNDVVAEITIDKETLDYTIPLVRLLTENGISSSITFIDIAKNEYYDFSNITDKSLLVDKSDKVKDILKELENEKYDVHMAKELLPKIYETLPSNLNCDIDINFHNITVDADSSIRLCTRIRGYKTPRYLLDEYINEEGILSESLIQNIKEDKKSLCFRCNHTCILMTSLIEEKKSNTSKLVHSDRR